MFAVIWPVAVVAALAILLFAFRGSWSRLAPVTTGLAVIALGFAVYLVYLPVRGKPARLLGSIGFVPPRLIWLKANGKAEDYQLWSSVGVQTNGCSNPVHVTINLDGPDKLFAETAGILPGLKHSLLLVDGSFLVTIPSNSVRHVQVRDGIRSELTDPIGAPSDAARYVELEHDAVTRVSRQNGETFVQGRLQMGGGTTSIVQFDADWLHPRGLQSCYLSLPNLVGGDTLTAARDGLLRPHPMDKLGPNLPPYFAPGDSRRDVVYDPFKQPEGTGNPTMQLSRGLTVVDVKGGDVASQNSSPSPNVQIGKTPGWTYQEAPVTTARGVASVALAPDQGCDATAVITLDNADFLQTLLLLEVGALIPLGLTLILLPWQTRYEDSFKKPASLTK